ncbi:DNA recombination protein RmuC [Chlorobium sp. N1]|uniref:DNA recombination protein RmuC n=1 Tax=Chlorobium sp. N1 TaxID=2491138 RepID=UPI00103D625F|nr:DNA recombination protein RmuC [Chlorobium sp. N1]TCD48346.1 DNA recombination protein RmuC [Chlorobium sp. N1]
MTVLLSALFLLLLILLAIAVRRIAGDAGDLEALRIEKAKLEAELEFERNRASGQSGYLEASEARLQEAFENLSRRMLDERGRALGEDSRARMDALLQPLREQLEGFRRRVDEVHMKDVELSGQLREQVQQLMTLNSRVSDEANNLARAIKGESKAQGDWGELVIERIFESSGLEEGREYSAQKSYRDEEGRLMRPDFMVHVPGGKSIVVDAKVSLTAFDRYVALDDGAERAEALREHVDSVKRHIAELEQKDYSWIGGNKTLDFIIMCIPVEPAWQAAMQGDPEIIYDLSGRNVVICGPATLMITLKLIAQIWRRENENRNAEKIAEKAGKIHDQVVLVAEALLDARKKLGGVSEAFDLALRRLSEGKGNLVGRVDDIRRLGAKVARRIPGELMVREDGEEEG